MLPPIENLPLASGDVIFISIPSVLYRSVAKATGSLASHVGIIFKDEEKGWMVAESRVPVATWTPLEKFLARTENEWFQVRRFKAGLTVDQVAVLRRECDKRMGGFYHFGFRYLSRRLFCSKLVYDVFKEALGIEVGKLETFRDLFGQQTGFSLFFWRLWFFGFIPWSRLTVTPASQTRSELLETVWPREGKTDVT